MRQMTDALINGSAGDDQIEGRGGNDSENGGAGNDTYIFAGELLGSDTITESASLDTDTIDLSNFGQTSGRYGVVFPLGGTALDHAADGHGGPFVAHVFQQSGH